MNGALTEMSDAGLPAGAVDGLRDAIDCNLYFFDSKVSIPVMYVVLGATTVSLIAIYVLLNVVRSKKK
jgi:multidrug/hemolysin transport system permease protein